MYEVVRREGGEHDAELELAAAARAQRRIAFDAETLPRPRRALGIHRAQTHLRARPWGHGHALRIHARSGSR